MAQKLKQQHEYVKKVIVIDSDILNIKDSINHDDEIIINQFNDLDLEAQKVFALNLKHADILIKKYHFKPYNGEIILLRTKKSELFFKENKLDNKLKNIYKKIRILKILGNHNNLFDERYIKSTALTIQQAIDFTF